MNTLATLASLIVFNSTLSHACLNLEAEFKNLAAAAPGTRVVMVMTGLGLSDDDGFVARPSYMQDLRKMLCREPATSQLGAISFPVVKQVGCESATIDGQEMRITSSTQQSIVLVPRDSDGPERLTIQKLGDRQLREINESFWANGEESHIIRMATDMIWGEGAPKDEDLPAFVAPLCRR